MTRHPVQLSVTSLRLAHQNAAVVQTCVPLVALKGDSYRMRAHRDAINALPARDHRWGILVITPEEFA